jgi:hypothetical protein
MIGRLSVLSMALLAACAPQPRSIGYFAAHPEAAAAIATACEAGRVRGRECANALAGRIAAADRARMDLYRRGF